MSALKAKPRPGHWTPTHEPFRFITGRDRWKPLAGIRVDGPLETGTAHDLRPDHKTQGRKAFNSSVSCAALTDTTRVVVKDHGLIVTGLYGMSGMRHWIEIVRSALAGFLEDDGWAISSHIALAMLTSMFPFLIFVTALAGFFGSKELAARAADLLFESWPQSVAAPISLEIQNVMTQQRGDLLTLSAVLAVYFSSSAIEALRIGLNRAYRVRETRAWWLLRLESIAYVIVAAVALLLLSLLVVFAPLVLLALDRWVPVWARVWDSLWLARGGLTIVMLVVALVIAHKWLAGGRRSIRAIAPGIVLTIVLSLGAAYAFGLYLAEFSRNYISTYAGIASVMIAIVFLYSQAAIFLMGGELNGAIARARGGI